MNNSKQIVLTCCSSLANCSRAFRPGKNAEELNGIVLSLEMKVIERNVIDGGAV